MKISPIACSPAQNYQNVSRKQNLPYAEMKQSPNFKGAKAGFWSIVGSVIGGAAGIALSGGILVPFMCAGAGSIVGGIYGQKDEPESDDYGNPYGDGPSGFDYIG